MFVRNHRWAVIGLGVVAISAVLVRWARTRPGYDPYGWLVWGYQTLHLNLNLGGAPSWKPLPYLFTVPYALAGRYELRLWMITAVAISLAGSIFAGRIAYRVTIGAATGIGSLRPDPPLRAHCRRNLCRRGCVGARGLRALHPQRPI